MLAMAKGFFNSSSPSAKSTEVGGSLSRPNNGAICVIEIIVTARSTLGDAPVISA